MTVDLKSLLSKPVDDAKAPVPPPPGTYSGIIKKYTFGESPEKKTPYVRFEVQPLTAGDDIDPDDLVAVGDLSKKRLSTDYYLTEDAIYRLKDLLISLGIPTGGRTFAETVPETVNLPVLVEVVHTPNKRDPQAQPYTNIKTMRAASAE